MTTKQIAKIGHRLSHCELTYLLYESQRRVMSINISYPKITFILKHCIK